MKEYLYVGASKLYDCACLVLGGIVRRSALTLGTLIMKSAIDDIESHIPGARCSRSEEVSK